MLGFSHPRPFSRKEVAMQVVRQESRRSSATELTVDLPDRPAVAPPPPTDLPLRFSVVYGLGEYLSIVGEHHAFLARRASPAARRRRWTGPLALAASGLALACLPCMRAVWLGLVGTPVFYMQRRRMPVSEFRIDAIGIERTTRAGRLVKRWDEVRAVRRYRRGYLLLFTGGGIPIPLRCLTTAQRQRLRALALHRTGG